MGQTCDGVPDSLVDDLRSQGGVEASAGDTRLRDLLADDGGHVYVVTRLRRLHNGYHETLQAGDDAMVWWYENESYSAMYARIIAIVEVTDPVCARSLLYAAVGWYEVQAVTNQLTGCAQVSWPVMQDVMEFVPVSLVRGQVMVTHVCTAKCVVARRCTDHIVVPDEPGLDKFGRSPRPVDGHDCPGCAVARSQTFHHPPPRNIRARGGGAPKENSAKWTADLFNVFTEADGFTAGRQRARA